MNEPKEFTRTDLRFAAYGGLFDGEGCISMNRVKRPRRYNITLRVVMIRREVLERMNSHFGAGTLNKYGPRPGRQLYWIWFCGKREEVIRILKRLQPHLDLKTHEANLALDFLLNENLTAAQQARIYESMRRAKVKKGNVLRNQYGTHSNRIAVLGFEKEA